MLIDFYPYTYLIIPFTALIITQFVKVVIDAYYHHPISMNSYGGMPSTHSALFASLVTVTWYYAGLASFEFAVSLILYLTIVRDAVGIRQQLGNHGAMLKQLIQEHEHDHHHNIPHEKIITRLGHTPLQATIGSLCGIAISLTMIYLANIVLQTV